MPSPSLNTTCEGVTALLVLQEGEEHEATPFFKDGEDLDHLLQSFGQIHADAKQGKQTVLPTDLLTAKQKATEEQEAERQASVSLKSSAAR